MSNLGICVKNIQGNILSQNEVCKKICIQNCQLQCMNDVGELGISSKKTIIHQDSYYENISINTGAEIITYLCPIDEKVKTFFLKIKEFKLTKKEMEVIRQKILCECNKEVSLKLKVSESTLHTHLNNIYKKLPNTYWPFFKK